MNKEYVFLINNNFALSLTSGKLINAEDLNHKKVYGCFYSSNTKYKTFSNLEEKYIKQEIDREFKEQQNLDVVYKSISINNNQYVYINQRDFIQDIISTYNMHTLVRIEQIFYKANKHLIESGKTILVGIINTINNTLVYQVYRENELASIITNVKTVGRALQEIDSKAIKDIVNVISNEYRIDITDYVIYGYNADYKDIIKALESIKYKETYNSEFQDNKAIFIKRILLTFILIFLSYPFLFAITYLKNDIILSYQNKQISNAKNIISNLENIKKQLYKEKGKTIILADEINFNKLSSILYPISYTQPMNIDYAVDKNNLEVTLIYNNTIIANALHETLKKDKVENTFYISPNTKQAKILIKIPITEIDTGLINE